MQQYLRKLEAEHRREHKIMEDHLYHCIYDIQQSDITPETKLAALNRYKANLVHLQVRRMEKLMRDTNKHNTIDGEEPTLFHMLKTMKQHKSYFR